MLSNRRLRRVIVATVSVLDSTNGKRRMVCVLDCGIHCLHVTQLHSTFMTEVRNTRIEVDDDGFDDFGRRKSVKKDL